MKLLHTLMKTGLLALLVVSLSACGADMIDVNQSESPGAPNSGEIEITAVDSANRVAISIPADFFEPSIIDARFTVSVNNVVVGEDMDPNDAAYFDTTSDAVEFGIDNIEAGDVILIAIVDATTGSGEGYEATVSATDTVFADLVMAIDGSAADTEDDTTT